MATEKNGLELFQINSSVKNDFGELTFREFNDLAEFLSENFKDKGFLIVYLDYKVIIRKFEGNKVVFFKNEDSFNPEFIQKLRLFNVNKELLIWRTEGKWKARLRVDKDGDESVDIVEANQVLFGTIGKVLNGATTLLEERGTEVILPYEIKDVDNKKNRVKIKTRNYLTYNEHGQAGYIDSRFVEFTFGIENKSIGEY